MNFEQNTGVTYYSNPNLESRIKDLEAKIKFLESSQPKVVFGGYDYLQSNTFSITSSIQDDKSVTLSYDLTNIMTGSDYKVISTDIVVTGLDKDGNETRLTTVTSPKSSITLQPHNFPINLAVRSIVSNGTTKTLFRSFKIQSSNFGEVSNYLTSLVTQESKKEMSIQEALDYLLSRIEAIK